MERTRIITAKITIIDKKAKDEPIDKKAIVDAIKKKLKADNVQVSTVKDYILAPNEEEK